MNDKKPSEIEKIQRAISMLEAQRTELGNDVVRIALTPSVTS
jgi:hypothetical protein